MNEIDKQRLKIIRIAIVTVAILSFICISSLCFTMFYKAYVDPAVLTSIITLTGTLTGSLTTIMVLPRPKDQPPDISVSAQPPTAEIKQSEVTA